MIVKASEFKAKCLKLMDRVSSTGEEILITKRGQPVARLVRPNRDKARRNFIGSMAGTVDILGEIVGPTGETWNAER